MDSCKICGTTEGTLFSDKYKKGFMCGPCSDFSSKAARYGREYSNSAYKRERLARMASGEARHNTWPTYRCVADPENVFLGSMFFEKQFMPSVEEGHWTTGSLWLNDHEQKVYEILGVEGDRQELTPVSDERLALMKMRFPRLKRALSNPTVC